MVEKAKTNIGLIGLDGRGRFLLDTLLKIEGVEVPAVFDTIA